MGSTPAIRILMVLGGISTVSAGASCLSSTGPSGPKLRLDDATGASSASFDVSACPIYPGGTEVERMCMIDSNGKTYREDGTLFAFPAAPPYGAYYQFKPGFAPLPADVSTTGADASVATFAAPVVITQTPCCAEDNPANRIASRATVTPQGGLLVVISEAVPAGDQVAIMLDYGALFRSQISPCTLPNLQFCQRATASLFLARFYVGYLPAGTPTPTPDAGPPPAGACLLAYNDALVTGDPCCYRQGGANTCDTSIACNDRSGAGCCLIYASESAGGEQRCCLYDSGEFGDDPDGCRKLLSAAR